MFHYEKHIMASQLIKFASQVTASHSLNQHNQNGSPMVHRLLRHPLCRRAICKAAVQLELVRDC